MDFTVIAVWVVCFIFTLFMIHIFTKREENVTKGTSLKNASGTANRKSTEIPNWNRPPADKQMGDLGLLSQQGSIHEYLLHIHDKGRNPITVFWWGTQRVVSVCSPDLFKDIVKYTLRPKKFFEMLEPLITPHSLVYANGLDWEERRKFLYPTLRDEFLKGYVPHFIKIANETATAWSQLSSGAEIVLQEEFFTMTIKGIARSCFGNKFNDDNEIKKFGNTFRAAWDEMEQRLHIGPPEPGSEREKTFNESLAGFNKLVMSAVKARQNGTDTDEIPFIDALLQSGVSDPQILADSMSFMFGGLHTSGYLLVWSLYYMTLYPEVMEKLIKEMKEQVGSDRGDKLIEYVYSTKTYLRKVLDESLRICTLVPYSARYADHDIAVGGYCIPAGTPVLLAIGVSLKNECLWKNANEFDPDEHFGKCPLQTKDSIAFSPFGIGRRKCPGYSFAQTEVSILLTILLQQFTLKPVVRGALVKPLYGLVTGPSEPLRYTVHPAA